VIWGEVASFLILLQLLRSALQLLVTANFVPGWLILFTLLIEAMRSSETSVLARATRRHIQTDGILHSSRRENLTPHKSKLLNPFSLCFR
jgi:hypothetical protein